MCFIKHNSQTLLNIKITFWNRQALYYIKYGCNIKTHQCEKHKCCCQTFHKKYIKNMG